VVPSLSSRANESWLLLAAFRSCCTQCTPDVAFLKAKDVKLGWISRYIPPVNNTALSMEKIRGSSSLVWQCLLTGWTVAPPLSFWIFREDEGPSEQSLPSPRSRTSRRDRGRLGREPDGMAE